jgi:hypothetical protein
MSKLSDAVCVSPLTGLTIVLVFESPGSRPGLLTCRPLCGLVETSALIDL